MRYPLAGFGLIGVLILIAVNASGDLPTGRAVDRKDQLISQQDAPDKAMLVMTGEKHYLALRDTNIVTWGSREFISGIDVGKTKFSKGMFPGKHVWVPIDDVTLMASLKMDDLKVD